jgi:hypothetical protein
LEEKLTAKYAKYAKTFLFQCFCSCPSRLDQKKIAFLAEYWQIDPVKQAKRRGAENAKVRKVFLKKFSLRDSANFAPLR